MTAAAEFLADARRVADAILYEGYLLYPYRGSAGKNQSRFQFGVLMPPAYRGVDASEPSVSQTECLLEGPDEEAVRTMPRVFEINFIDAGPGGKVSGTVGPYEEIGLDCNLQTMFTGTLAGDGMAGTFRTECVAGSSLVGRPTTGIWAVTRKK